MNYFSRAWRAVTIAAMVLTSYQPVQAATFKAPSVIVAGEGVAVDVRSGRRIRRPHRGGRSYRGGRRYRGGRNYRGGRRYRGGRYYGGGRRYRGGRYYGGDLAVGIIGGLIVGGIIAEANRRRYYDDGNSNAHDRWCHNRYRSYKSRTNTWTAYSGRVRQCNSPYN
jgi:hypothetical protein